MNASDRILARRYGKAFFEAAAAAGLDARIAEDLSAADRVLRDALVFLKDPRISLEKKKEFLRKNLEGRAAPLTRRFLDFLIEKKRFALIPDIVSALVRLGDEKNHRGRAAVWSAQPLSLDDERAIRSRLEKFFGLDIDLEFKRDPGMIAGVRVRMGDWLVDSSLRQNLRNLGETLNGD
ncbi:MAG: ATP synthase F1 subunit delta [Elusimicrobiota bacterium]